MLTLTTDCLMFASVSQGEVSERQSVWSDGASGQTEPIRVTNDGVIVLLHAQLSLISRLKVFKY